MNVGESFEYGTYYQSLLDQKKEMHFDAGNLEPGVYKVIDVDRNEADEFCNVKLQLT